jgi:hypothetical protein
MMKKEEEEEEKEGGEVPAERLQLRRSLISGNLG